VPNIDRSESVVFCMMNLDPTSSMIPIRALLCHWNSRAPIVSPTRSTADENVGTTTGETDLAVDADGNVIVVASYLTIVHDDDNNLQLISWIPAASCS
jgi:DNA-binding beta-propeller fold protein YncE